MRPIFAPLIHLLGLPAFSRSYWQRATLCAWLLASGTYPAFATIITAGGADPAINVIGNKTVGALVVGTNTDGTLDITKGSILTVNPGNTRFGRDEGVIGTGLVTGVGSALKSTGDIIIGDRGTAALTIEKGANVTSNDLIEVGALRAPGDGRLVVTGKGSTATAKRLVVGDEGATGSLRVAGGATITLAQGARIGQLGALGAGNGRALVTGRGSVMDIKGDLSVGGGSTGKLDILLDGAVKVGKDAIIGGTGPLARGVGNGSLNLQGPRTRFDVGGSLFVGLGKGSTGKADINNSTVKVGKTIFIGSTGATGSLTESFDSRLAAKDLSLDGKGTMTVDSGSRASFANSIILGGTGGLTVDGKGSSVTAGGMLITPAGSTAKLNVFDGAKLMTANKTLIATTMGAAANVGAGSTLAAEAVELGGPGLKGTLTVGNGGTVDSTVDVLTGGVLITGKGATTVTADVNNSGRVAIAPGTLSVGGAYTQNEDGNLQIELSSPTLFGMLDITAKAVFAPGATLDFDFVGFTPTEGQSFTFLTAKGGVNLLPNDFNCAEDVFTCDFSGVPQGLEFEVESSPEALTLVTLNSVSEPTTLGILGASLVMLVCLRRRRRHETLLPEPGSRFAVASAAEMDDPIGTAWVRRGRSSTVIPTLSPAAVPMD